MNTIIRLSNLPTEFGIYNEESQDFVKLVRKVAKLVQLDAPHDEWAYAMYGRSYVKLTGKDATDALVGTVESAIRHGLDILIYADRFHVHIIDSKRQAEQEQRYTNVRRVL